MIYHQKMYLLTDIMEYIRKCRNMEERKKVKRLDICKGLYYMDKGKLKSHRGYHLDDNSGFYADVPNKKWIVIDKNTGLKVIEFNFFYCRSIESVNEFYPLIKELIKRRRILDQTSYRKDAIALEQAYFNEHGRMIWYHDVES